MVFCTSGYVYFDNGGENAVFSKTAELDGTFTNLVHRYKWPVVYFFMVYAAYETHYGLPHL